MSAHILLNELGKRDKMRGMHYNKGAQILDFIYHMTLKLF